MAQLTIDTSEELTKLNTQLEAINAEYEQVRRRAIELEAARGQIIGAIQLVQMYEQRADEQAKARAEAESTLRDKLAASDSFEDSSGRADWNKQR